MQERETWQFIHDMITSLGIDGGSSDESNPEPHSTRVFVRDRDWRNPNIIKIMQTIDRFKPNSTGHGRILPGNPGRPRERREGTQYISQDTPLRDLPMNYYAPIWLNTLTLIRKQWLNPQPEK